MEDNQDAEPERSVTVTKIPDVNNFRGRRTYFGSWIQRSQSMMVERAEQLTSWCQEAKREKLVLSFCFFPVIPPWPPAYGMVPAAYRALSGNGPMDTPRSMFC
jgi:hypothetical protein